MQLLCWEHSSSQRVPAFPDSKKPGATPPNLTVCSTHRAALASSAPGRPLGAGSAPASLPSRSPRDPWGSEGGVLMPANAELEGTGAHPGLGLGALSILPLRAQQQHGNRRAPGDVRGVRMHRAKGCPASPGKTGQAWSAQAAELGAAAAGARQFKALLRFLSAFGSSSEALPTESPVFHPESTQCANLGHSTSPLAKRSILTLQTISLNLSARPLSGQSSTFPISWVLG